MTSSAGCERCTRRSASTGSVEMGGRAVRVGVVGATGMVGAEMLRTLEERAFPVTPCALRPRAARIDRMVVSTSQSVSGAGAAGAHELDAQWTKLSGGAEELRRAGALDAPVVESEVWPKPIAGNVLPLAGSIKEQGYTSEEWKM